MKKYIRGFLMAWGNFSAIPCPYHKWHDESRKAMLCMLPVVGIMLSVIVCIAWWALDLIGVPAILTGAVLTALYFIANGFIHLDGFMDCSDAILSRRPELEERQRILKASDVGAFAVISVMLMSIIFAASMMTLAEDFSLEKASILLITMMISRAMAADYVGKKPAMKTSQYADLGGSKCDNEADANSVSEKIGSEKKLSSWEQGVLTLMIVIPVLAVPRLVIGGGEGFPYLGVFSIVALIVLVAAMVAGRYAIKQLGGMNGDIAGYMVVMSETIGVLTAAVLASVV